MFELCALKRYLSFVCVLRIELYTFAFVLSIYIRQTPLSLLIQDKICLQKYNMSRHFCADLALIDSMADNFQYKSPILADTAQYGMYQTLINVCPAALFSLFLGSFVDSYKHGNKVLLIIGALTSVAEAMLCALNALYFDWPFKYVLFSFIPYSFSGLMVFNICFAYASAATPTQLKTIRLMILEICIIIPQYLGHAMAGYLVNLRPFGFANSSQLHNYALVFLISGAGNLLAFVWTLLMIDQQNDKKRFYKLYHNNNIPVEEDERAETLKDVNPVRLLFNISNVRAMVRTAFKRRDHRVREQIWLVNVSLCILYIGYMAPAVFQFQFVEKIYRWDAETYGYANSITAVTQAMTILIITPILVKIFKFNDMTLTIIGFTGYFIQNLICALILKPIGFYISLVFTSIVRLGAIGVKTHLTKIVDASEFGRVNAFLSFCDTSSPIISSLFSIIFKLSIDSCPGLCYLILALLMLFPVFFAVWINYYNKYYVR